jgi:hypothetical protein
MTVRAARGPHEAVRADLMSTGRREQIFKEMA